MDYNDFFKSKEQLEEQIFLLNKSIEERTAEMETINARSSILEYTINRDKKKLKELKERIEDES